MTRKLAVGVAFCIVLLGAILAGYWDMLDSERLRALRDGADRSIAELAGRASPPERGGPERSTPPSAGEPSTGTPAAGTSQPAEPTTEKDASPPSTAPNAPAGVAATAAGRKPQVEPSRPRVPSGDDRADVPPASPQSTAAGTPASSAPASDDATPPAVADGGEPAAADGGGASTPSGPPPSGGNVASNVDPASRVGAKPSFDIVRVQPDGSAVFAGRARPNADVRLVDGETTLGSAKASAAGDFVIVLKNRLPVGEHQIRIADTSVFGATVSDEIATVSIPATDRPNELLAMVEAPNRPSRIVSAPTPEEGSAVENGAQSGAGGQIAAVQPDSGASALGEADGAAASAAPGSPSNDSAAQPSPFAVEAIEFENGTLYVAGRAPGADPVRIYVDNQLLGTDAARRNGRFLVTGRVPLAVGNHQVRVDKIGADGVVATRVEVPFARPDGEAMAAIAANEVPETSSAAENDPPAQVAAATMQPPDAPRAEPEKTAPSTMGNEAGPTVPTSDPAATRPRDDIAPSIAPSGRPSVSGGDANGATANPSAPTDAVDPSERDRAAVTAGSQSTASNTRDETASSNAIPNGTPPVRGGQAGDRSASSANDDASAANGDPGDPASGSTRSDSSPSGSADAKPGTGGAAATSPATVTRGGASNPASETSPSTQVSNAAPVVASADMGSTSTERVASSDIGSSVATIHQPALEAVKRRVIIRRGDTLWRISRTTYGLGRRYTVIYLANGDQIRDPDRIYPGQVFRLPKSDATAVR